MLISGASNGVSRKIGAYPAASSGRFYSRN
jgi:hypothetical protein